MHAAMMCMSGFPMLSSGDEIAQLNGYAYREDPNLREDSRNLHRTKFNWDNAALRTQPGTVQQRIWDGLRQLEELRVHRPAFGPGTWVSTWDAHNSGVLAIVRRAEAETLVCLFNFTGRAEEVRLEGLEGRYADLITGREGLDHRLEPYQYGLYRLEA